MVLVMEMLLVVVVMVMLLIVWVRKVLHHVMGVRGMVVMMRRVVHWGSMGMGVVLRPLLELQELRYGVVRVKIVPRLLKLPILTVQILIFIPLLALLILRVIRIILAGVGIRAGAGYQKRKMFLKNFKF